MFVVPGNLLQADDVGKHVENANPPTIVFKQNPRFLHSLFENSHFRGSVRRSEMKYNLKGGYTRRMHEWAFSRAYAQLKEHSSKIDQVFK